MAQRGGVWDRSDCVLVLIDYQENVLGQVFEQDRKVIELNARILAQMAQDFDIPVIISTVGVEMGVNGPAIPSLTEAVPDVAVIDRSNMDAWADDNFRAAVKATGRRRLVMCGISTSVCLAYPVVLALADGYDVMFIEDAVGDSTKEIHETAVLRLVQAGAVPNTTQAMMSEWFRDWALPVADKARARYVPYREEWAALVREPETHAVAGLV
jgi:nicotinamidase-related amidase